MIFCLGLVISNSSASSAVKAVWKALLPRPWVSMLGRGLSPEGLGIAAGRSGTSGISSEERENLVSAAKEIADLRLVEAYEATDLRTAI